MKRINLKLNSRVARALSLVLSVLVLGSSSSLVSVIAAAATRLDPQDIVQVEAPIADSVVMGNTPLKFIVFDDDKSQVPTRLDVLDPSCRTKLRTLSNNTYPSQKTPQVINWDTKGGYKNGPALPDGQYCLSLCADLKAGSTSYTFCNRRRVSVRNAVNAAPRFTSNPVLTVAAGNNYRYVITTSDAEGDRVTLKALVKPGFLTLAGTVLQGRAPSTAGSYNVTLEAKDALGAGSKQSFTITVTSNVVVPPTPTPTETPAPSPTPLPQTISFVFPRSASVLTPTDSEIRWQIVGISDYDKQVLSIRKVGENNWQELATLTATERRNYTLDVSAFENGEYELRLELKQGNTVGYELISSQFSIASKDNDGETPGEDVVTFGNLTPAPGAVVSELRPQISVEINLSGESAGTELKKEQIKLTLNKTDYTADCEFLKQSTSSYLLKCAPSQDLSNGEVTAEIIVSAGSVTANRDWQFSVTTTAGVEEEFVPFLGLNLPRTTANLLTILCLVLLFLLALPLLLFMLARRSDQRTTSTRSNTTTTTTTVLPPAAAVVPVAAVAATKTANEPGLLTRIGTSGQNLVNNVRSRLRPAAKTATPAAPVTNTDTSALFLGDPLGTGPITINKPTVTTAPVATPVPLAPAAPVASTGNILTGDYAPKPIAPAVSRPVVAAPVVANPTPPTVNITNNIPAATPINNSAPVVAPAAAPVVVPVAVPVAATVATSVAAPAAPPTAAPVTPPVKEAAPLAVATAPLAPAADIPVSTPAAATPVKADAAVPTQTDLPEWLRTDSSNASVPAQADAAAQAQAEKNAAKSAKTNDEDADPYGFGEFTLGD